VKNWVKGKKQRAINLQRGDWIKVGGQFYYVIQKVRHVQSVEIACRIDSHPFNNFIMYVPDHMLFKTYYRKFLVMEEEE
jgi:hypothetical protein